MLPRAATECASRSSRSPPTMFRLSRTARAAARTILNLIHCPMSRWSLIQHGPISARATRPDMNALANHAFVKMNGLGNEIVVVDMRGRPQAITAAEARAAATAEPYDQLMAIYPPRTVE